MNLSILLFSSWICYAIGSPFTYRSIVLAILVLVVPKIKIQFEYKNYLVFIVMLILAGDYFTYKAEDILLQWIRIKTLFGFLFLSISQLMFWGSYKNKELITFWSLLSLSVLIEININSINFLAYFFILIPILMLKYSPHQNKNIFKILSLTLLFIGLISFVFYKSKPYIRWDSRYNYSNQNPIGFDKNSDLNSFASLFTNNEVDRPEIRIIGDEEIRFLGAQAQDTYINGRWYVKGSETTIFPSGNRMNHFDYINNSLNKLKSKWIVFPLYSQSNDWVFTPSPFFQISIEEDSLKEQNGRYLRSKNIHHTPYYLLDKAKDTLGYFFSKSKIPVDLISQFKGIEKLNDSRSIIIWVDSIFKNHYEYSLLIKKPTLNIDPLVYFNQTKKGYCEYFASTGVLLLQHKGIAARLVKGFAYPIKENDRQWLYTSKKAHVWVEYKFDGNWKIWDPTPAGFFPNSVEVSFVKKIFDQFMFKLKFIFFQLKTGTWVLSIENLVTSYGALFLLLISSVVLFVVFKPTWKKKIRYVYQLKNKYQIHSKKNEPLLHLISKIKLRSNVKELHKLTIIEREYKRQRFKITD